MVAMYFLTSNFSDAKLLLTEIAKTNGHSHTGLRYF